MFKDSQNSLHSEVLDRRQILKQRIVDLLKNPEFIVKQKDILFVEKYDNFLAFYFHSPIENKKYQAVPLGCSLTEESRYLLFCYERNWEKEGYNESTPVIEIKNGEQMECGILDLDDLDDVDKIEMEIGFDEVQRIIAEENATISR